ncbi:MAG: redoxin domain-containing protein [Myxococcota bacterium]
MELPDIQEQFVDEYGSQGLNVIALDPDADDHENIDLVRAFVQNQGVSFPIAVEDSTVTPTYATIEAVYDGANPYPVDILIDKQGIIRYVSREYDPTGLHGLIPQLLAE